MTNEDLENLYQFLGGYWYDREEDDFSIVNEFVAENPPHIVANYINSIRHFINSSDPMEVKSDYVRKMVWRYFPEDVEAPIKWLKEIHSLLEEAAAKKAEGETESC